MADMLVRALPLVSPTSETLIAARLGSCPEEQASRFVVGSLERPGPAARAPEGCHISRRAAAAAWPVHPKGRPSARRRQLAGLAARGRAGCGEPGRSASCVLVTRASQLHRRVLAVSTRKGEARQGETIQGFSLTSHIDDAAQNVLAFPWQSDGGPARMAANCVFFQAARCNL